MNEVFKKNKCGPKMFFPSTFSIVSQVESVLQQFVKGGAGKHRRLQTDHRVFWLHYQLCFYVNT